MRQRGRKGIREKLEQQNDLVILNPQEHKGKWQQLFGNSNPIYVELGMGKGKFISEMSALCPGINFIGVDMFDSLLRLASEKARLVWQERSPEGPPNLKLALFNIALIEEIFAKGEITRIFLNFSDPWPKKRHARRRLTHAEFVLKYISVLNPFGEIHLKTDSRSLFEFSLNSFADMGLRLRKISLDLHGDGPAIDNVMTEYETKFVQEGQAIYRCEVIAGEQALHQHITQLNAKKTGSIQLTASTAG
ncbi:MAG TPA: tRNA (guanosine(46)-N7)-methyltransferase TrmB [Bacilli bacterium]